MSEDKEQSDAIRKIVNISELMHTPVRLAILLFLHKYPVSTFPELKLALNVSSGNLSSHIKKLENGKMIYVEKKFIDAKPSTLVSLTIEGITALAEYKNILKSLLDSY